MKRKIAAALLAFAVLGIGSTTLARADEGLPRWFRDFIAALEGRLGQFAARFQALEQQTAQNTSAITQNTAAIAQANAAIAQNAAATAQNTAAITQNTADIAQNAATTNSAIQQGAAAIALNTADIARNSLDIARNSADIAALQGSAQATYRYVDYAGTNIATKTFTATGNGHCGNTETQIFTRTPQPDGSILLTIDQDRRQGPNRCQYQSTRFRIDDSGQELSGSDVRNTADPAVTLSTANLDVPIPTKLNSMRIGQTFGSASKSTRVNFLAGGATDVGFNTILTTLLAVESVTVPAGTFTDCLRFVEVRNTAHFGIISQVDWVCRDVGVVRRLQSNNVISAPSAPPTSTTITPFGFVLEMQSYTTQ